MAERTLVSNPRSIGEIFFSGSQEVKKGDEVTWILDETWAFKATEDCAVSTNASPFVNIKAGQVFLIYKRTQEDIAAGNSKGIYIFDRDTVVALAYPQEFTQDIIIENDIYNDNYNTIIVEAEKNPTAIMSYSPNPVYQGDIVTLRSESFAVDPATISEYRWVKNGVFVSDKDSFSYKAGTNSSDNITLTVTDSGGRKNIAQQSIKISVRPVLPIKDYVATDNKGSGYGLGSHIIRLASMTIPETTTGLVTLYGTAYTENSSSQDACQLRVGYYINGVLVAYNDRRYTEGQQGVQTINFSYHATISSGSVVELMVWRIAETGLWECGIYAGGYSTLSMKIDPNK